MTSCRREKSAVRRANVPGTADTPENLQGGVLIVVPPELGPEITELPELPSAAADAESGSDPAESFESRRAQIERPRGVITAARVNRGPEIGQLLRWLEAAGFPAAESARRFAVFTWPERWAGAPHDRRAMKRAAEEAGRLWAEIARRSPLIVIFVSAQLLDAANLPEVLPGVAQTLGAPLEPVRRLSDIRLRVTAQRWQKALCLGVPVPRKTFSAAAEEAIAAALRSAFVREGFLD